MSTRGDSISLAYFCAELIASPSIPSSIIKWWLPSRTETVDMPVGTDVRTNTGRSLASDDTGIMADRPRPTITSTSLASGIDADDSNGTLPSREVELSSPLPVASLPSGARQTLRAGSGTPNRL